jgi:MinD-like ATPase involved in chromosome partitioning or flagellar assembly
MAALPTTDTVLSPSNDVVSREIDGQRLIVPLDAGVGDVDDLFTLNETGAAIWELLDGERRLADVVEEVVRRFDAPRSDVEADVLTFAADLVARGFAVARS